MSLKSKLLKQIAADGPLNVAAYMAACLYDTEYGYYARGAGLGSDFTTSPEISQVFGELMGLWAAHEWIVLGRPDPFLFVEMGPGRGVLMADALRATKGVAGFHKAMHLALVETSPELKKEQAERLSEYAPGHFRRLEDIPEGAMILLSNELLDCFPARQFARSRDGWRERAIGSDGLDALSLGLTEVIQPPFDDTVDLSEDPILVEIQPGLDALVAEVARRAAKDKVRALFVDYGTDRRPPGDSLRAFYQGRQVDPLALPGLSDLTVDVDFPRLKRLAEAAGLGASSIIPQGGFLMRLGAQTRLNSLVEANPEQGEALFEGVRRLIDPGDMGERFKAICLSSRDLPQPVGFVENGA